MRLGVCGYRVFASLEHDESARTLGVSDAEGWKKQLNKNTSSSVEQVVEVAGKSRLF